MNNRRLALFAGLGCAFLLIAGLVAGVVLLLGPVRAGVGELMQGPRDVATTAASEVTREIVQPTPTVTAVPEAPEGEATIEPEELADPQPDSLTSLYQDVSPGVVNITVYVERSGMTGQGAGSGFVFDDAGHIVTNHHVVAQADAVTVIYYDGLEVPAEIVGTDPDSDLAVVKVESLPDSVYPLQIAESNSVQPGGWVVAIGNPFRFGGSMTLGIVSAVGRTIPTADTPFSIPKAIQTDAAINPGNSGGPLLNLGGQVVGVNAQIATGSGTNSGVGFAIPSDVVRRVVPGLIERGTYTWPWLGVRGGPVNLLVQEANDLDAQRGAYLAVILENGPAAEAGLQGATGERQVFGQSVPVGGDVVIAADDEPVQDFADLLTFIAFKRPGDRVTLTILRDGAERDVTVRLVERPPELSP